MGIVFISFVCSVLLLLWLGRGDGIAPHLKLSALGKLAGFYLPLLSLMAAFYFVGTAGRRRSATVPIDAFVFAMVIVFLWVLIPLFLLSFLFVEDFLVTIEKVKPFGDSLALAAVGYYFAKN